MNLHKIYFVFFESYRQIQQMTNWQYFLFFPLKMLNPIFWGKYKRKFQNAACWNCFPAYQALSILRFYALYKASELPINIISLTRHDEMSIIIEFSKAKMTLFTLIIILFNHIPKTQNTGDRLINTEYSKSREKSEKEWWSADSKRGSR